MRNVVLALLTLVLGATPAASQGSWAEKMFNEGTAYDFKSIPRGTQLYHRFKMTNIYAVPLEFNTRVGCSCVTATPSANVLQSRQEGYIEITMDARRFTGFKSVNIYVTVGPEYISTATLQVVANSRADVVLNPGEVMFGVVSSGQKPAAQNIDVEYAGVLDWRITEVVQHNAPFDVTYQELYRRPGQVGYRVTVTLKPDALAGSLKHELFLKTNDPASPLVPILVEGTIQATLTALPTTLNLGNLKVGETLTKKVIVRGHKPFRVLAVEGTGDGVAVELPTSEAALQFVQVKCQPAKAGEIKKQLRIKTNLDQDAVVTVAVEGTVEP